jgi:hypothetical protein
MGDSPFPASGTSQEKPMKFMAHSYKDPHVEFPIFGTTFDGKEVECSDWDEETERWVDTDGCRHRPDDLHTVCPPSEDGVGYYRIDIPLLGVTLDGLPVRVTGWQPFVPQWETDTGEHHPVINCPRPEIGCRWRSLDADWQS